jgi:hypothetical protein
MNKNHRSMWMKLTTSIELDHIVEPHQVNEIYDIGDINHLEETWQYVLVSMNNRIFSIKELAVWIKPNYINKTGYLNKLIT